MFLMRGRTDEAPNRDFHVESGAALSAVHVGNGSHDVIYTGSLVYMQC